MGAQSAPMKMARIFSDMPLYPQRTCIHTIFIGEGCVCEAHACVSTEDLYPHSTTGYPMILTTPTMIHTCPYQDRYESIERYDFPLSLYKIRVFSYEDLVNSCPLL